jgi:hypothetical protein
MEVDQLLRSSQVIVEQRNFLSFYIDSIEGLVCVDVVDHARKEGNAIGCINIVRKHLCLDIVTVQVSPEYCSIFSSILRASPEHFGVVVPADRVNVGEGGVVLEQLCLIQIAVPIQVDVSAEGHQH